MSLVDHIISGAVLLIVLIAVGTIITSQSVQTTQERIDFRQTSFMLDKHEGSLNTIMSINEPETRQSYARLLARSIYENRDTITLPSGEDVNISDLIDDALAMVYGPENYYAQISPFINDVHIRLVFDGTGSLEHERDVIREKLEDIITETKEDLEYLVGEGNAPDITFKAYIVTDDLSLCEPFNDVHVTGFAGCEIVEKIGAYGVLEEPEVDGPLNHVYGQEGRETYYRGDWAAGIAKSLNNLLGDLDDDSRSIIIMFPVTDEMTTGNIPNECYGTDITNPNEDPLITGGTETRVLTWNAYYCALCHNDCPEVRSQAQITQLTTFIESHETIRNALFINPVYSDDWIEYDDDFNNPIDPVRWSGYVDNFIDVPGEYNPGDGQTYCDFDNCRGCETNPDDSSLIRFRSVCAGQTEEQLDNLSSAYRGTRIDLLQVDELPDEIIRSVGEAASALVTSYGERRDEDSRYVVTYSILLPNNERVPFTVWIYEDRVFDVHVPDITITAQPSAVPPGQPIELVSEIVTRGGVASVRLTPHSQEEPIELELLTRTGITYTHYTNPNLDTTGLEDGSYDVSYEVYDTAFNRFEGTEPEVFTIDSDLRPYPEIMNENVILQDIVLENRNADAIVGIINDPDAAGVEAVWIEVTDPNGNTERYDLELNTYWTESFNVGSVHGTHVVSVFIEDDLERVRTYTSIDSFEVVQRLACTSRDVCLEHGLAACTGDEQWDYYCSDEWAEEGEFAAERQSCQSGLGWDSNTHECYEPTTTYDLIFVPLMYPDTAAGRTAFTNTVNVVLQGLEELSPINQCEPDLRSSLFKYHLSQDFSCYLNHGCNTGDFESCLEAAKECGESAFPGVGDRFFGISPSSWGSIQGVAAYLGSTNMITSQQSSTVVTRNIALHEAGHTWHLGHLRTGVPASGLPCREEYLNRADCDHPDEIRFLMNYALSSSNKQFGPAGYATIENYHLADQLRYCS